MTEQPTAAQKRDFAAEYFKRAEKRFMDAKLDLLEMDREDQELIDAALSERAAIVKMLYRRASIFHELAADTSDHLRVQHIALSSAYSTAAQEIQRGDHNGEGK